MDAVITITGHNITQAQMDAVLAAAGQLKSEKWTVTWNSYGQE